MFTQPNDTTASFLGLGLGLGSVLGNIGTLPSIEECVRIISIVSVSSGAKENKDLPR